MNELKRGQQLQRHDKVMRRTDSVPHAPALEQRGADLVQGQVPPHRASRVVEQQVGICEREAFFRGSCAGARAGRCGWVAHLSALHWLSQQ